MTVKIIKEKGDVGVEIITTVICFLFLVYSLFSDLPYKIFYVGLFFLITPIFWCLSLHSLRGRIYISSSMLIGLIILILYDYFYPYIPLRNWPGAGLYP